MVPLVIFIIYSCFDVVCVGCSQNGLATKVEKSRKQMKERRNRAKKIRGVKKVMFSLMVTTHCFLWVTLDCYSYNQDYHTVERPLNAPVLRIAEVSTISLQGFRIWIVTSLTDPLFCADEGFRCCKEEEIE
jgi:hypothetical protein